LILGHCGTPPDSQRPTPPCSAPRLPAGQVLWRHATSSDAGLQPPIHLPPCRRPAGAKARPAVCDTSGQPLRPSCFATRLTSGQGTRRPSTSSPLAGNLEQILCAPRSRPRQGLARPAGKRPRYTQIQRCKIPRQPLHVHVRVMASWRGRWSGLARPAVRRGMRGLCFKFFGNKDSLQRSSRSVGGGRRVDGREGRSRVQTHGWGGAVKWGDREWEIKEYRPSDMVE